MGVRTALKVGENKGHGMRRAHQGVLSSAHTLSRAAGRGRACTICIGRRPMGQARPLSDYGDQATRGHYQNFGNKFENTRAPRQLMKLLLLSEQTGA